MKCKEARKLLQEYLEGTLKSARSKRLEAHIQGCTACKKELEALKKYFSSINSVESVQAPDGFLNSVRQRIEEAQQPRRIIPFRVKVPLELAGAVAAIVIAVIIFRNIPSEKRGLRPQPADEISTPSEMESHERIPSQKELRTQRETEALKKLPSQREPYAAQEKAPDIKPMLEKEAADDMELVSPKEKASDIESVGEAVQETETREVSPQEKSGLQVASVEEQIPVELVLVLAGESPETPALSAKAEGVKMKRLEIDEEAPQRAAEMDKKTFDDEPSGDIPADYNTVSEVERLARRLGGMVISMEYTKEGNLLRHITIEIPAEQSSEFMDGLKKLGEINKKTEEIAYEGDMILFSIELAVK